jgi:parallel beta-helix repeat protein
MKSFFFIAILLMTCSAGAQQYLELTDNMEIPSNSNIKILGGEYTFGDSENNGVIQIFNKEYIILDGDSVVVHGMNYQGYLIRIENSSNVVIRNFNLADQYKYAVWVKNSHDILIEDNNFSYNKVDTVGWINVWANVNGALGGGVLFYLSHRCEVANNVLQYQNDGVALYNSDSIHVHHNQASWNRGFGVRMNYTDSSYIHHNVCHHINRITNPSDCAAILMIVSNENVVEYNDFSYSGDGIFLGQFEHSDTPNNNLFAYNECSFSPHNAIEATFAGGNVYKHNNCNYSHYGFWLGYSFNSLVDSNEVIGNQYSGIAIDKGYSNVITHNVISENPTGIELWEGDPIPPYQDQESKDYVISHNVLEGNTIAVSAIETEHLVAKNNQFIKSGKDFFIDGYAEYDTITDNLFDYPTTFYFENLAYENIYAINNDFVINDEILIAQKIYDAMEFPFNGLVVWHPFVAGEPPVWQTNPPDDMAEPPAVWYAYPETCPGYGLWAPTTIGYDTEQKVVGDASVHISTGNGWDIAATYRPGPDSMARWMLTEMDSISVWYRSENNTGFGFQYHWIILGNNWGGYYKYIASAASILNPTIGQWKHYMIPVAGNSQWSRTSQGTISLEEINYIEIHVDTWEYGFEFWIDGLTFTPYFTGIQDNTPCVPLVIDNCYPNPVKDRLIINYTLAGDNPVTLIIRDAEGKVCKEIKKENQMKGSHSLETDIHGLKAGVYFYTLNAGDFCQTRRFAVLR